MHNRHRNDRGRTYEAVYNSLHQELTDQYSPSEKRQRFLEELYDQLGDHPISWCGFYYAKQEDPEKLFLAENLPIPACSPIGMHGVCGQSFRQNESIIVEDVQDLGDNYIACDPDDRSEIVLPIPSESESLWGVFDADSHEVGTFDEVDRKHLKRLLDAFISPVKEPG